MTQVEQFLQPRPIRIGWLNLTLAIQNRVHPELRSSIKINGLSDNYTEVLTHNHFLVNFLCRGTTVLQIQSNWLIGSTPTIRVPKLLMEWVKLLLWLIFVLNYTKYVLITLLCFLMKVNLIQQPGFGILRLHRTAL